MVFLCTSKPTKSVRSVMVRLVQCLGIGSSIGATPVALQNALLDTSRRLVAGLFILKHMHDLSGEVLCALAGEPVLPMLLPRIELLPPPALRPPLHYPLPPP